jgi:hypothetical protein
MSDNFVVVVSQLPESSARIRRFRLRGGPARTHFHPLIARAC